MSKHAVSAAGGANLLLELSDKIDRIVHLVEAARMAAGSDAVPEDVAAPIETLLAVVAEELRAVCVPALALPAVAAAEPADPVFAAIERHRAAVAAFRAAINQADEVLAKQEDREVTQGDEGAEVATGEAEDEARADLLEAPTTVAGVGALLRYLLEVDEGCNPADVNELVAALLNAPIFAA